MKYLEWNIEEKPLDYVFSKDEIEGVDYLNMVNLYKRGDNSQYILPSDCALGQYLTIRNEHYGRDEGLDSYYGVEFILNQDTEADRRNYWFFFRDQTVSFIFNGHYWIPNFPKPLPIAQSNFIEQNSMAYGFADITEYPDKKKFILFSNVDMQGFDVTSINGRFFSQFVIKLW